MNNWIPYKLGDDVPLPCWVYHPKLGVSASFDPYIDGVPKSEDFGFDEDKEITHWMPMVTTPPPPPSPHAMNSQPAPVANSNQHIADLVCADIMDRKAAGVAKYGVALQAGNGRDALVDAYQEALDLSQYLKQAIEERAVQGRPTLPKITEDMVCVWACKDAIHPFASVTIEINKWIKENFKA